jgi:hypothetical protein
MNYKDISNALAVLTPKAHWVLQGNDLTGLVWLDTVQTRPTDDQINVAIATYVPPTTTSSLQDQIAALQAQVAALLAAQGK